MMRARYTNRKNNRKILRHVLSHKIVPILNKVPFPYFQHSHPCEPFMCCNGWEHAKRGKCGNAMYANQQFNMMLAVGLRSARPLCLYLLSTIMLSLSQCLNFFCLLCMILLFSYFDVWFFCLSHVWFLTLTLWFFLFESFVSWIITQFQVTSLMSSFMFCYSLPRGGKY